MLCAQGAENNLAAHLGGNPIATVLAHNIYGARFCSEIERPTYTRRPYLRF